jgi:hypothetical protein
MYAKGIRIIGDRYAMKQRVLLALRTTWLAFWKQHLVSVFVCALHLVFLPLLFLSFRRLKVIILAFVNLGFGEKGWWGGLRLLGT